MQLAYNPKAPRKAANLSVNADLLAKAREQGINLSATLEQALLEALEKRRREEWLTKNSEAIEAYNTRVEEAGVFSDGIRSF